MIDKVGKETLEIMSTVAWYNQWLFDLVKNDLRGKILEVGAGIGNFTTLLASKGEVYAVDYNKSYIKNLKKELPRNIKVGFGDIEKGRLDFSNLKFETIICMNVLEHIKNDQKALENMHSILSMKGKLILLVPAFNFAYGKLDANLGHFRRYSSTELSEKLTRAGFKVKKTRYINFLGIFGWFLNSRIMKRDLIPRTQLLIFNLIARPLLYLEKYFNFPLGLSVLVVGTKE